MNAGKILQFSIGPVASAFIGFITIPMLAWLFSESDIGKFALINTVIGLFSILLCLGLDQYYVRVYHGQSNKEGLLGFTLLYSNIAVIIIFCFFLLFARPLFERYFGISEAYFYLLAFISFTSNLRFLSLVLRVQEKGLLFSISQLGQKVFFLFFVCVFFYAGEQGFIDILNALLLSHVIVFFYFVFVCKGDVFNRKILQIRTVNAKEAFSYSLPLVPAALLYWALAATDKISLSYLSDLSQLGLYSVSVSFAAVATIMQSIFSTIWAPTVFKWESERVSFDKIFYFRDGLIVVIIYAMALISFFGWVIDYILPPQYYEVKYIVVCCLFQPFMYMLSEVTGIGIALRKKTQYITFIVILTFLMNLSLNFVLIPGFGAKGAAVATATSFFFFYFLKTLVSSRIWVNTLSYIGIFIIFIGYTLSVLQALFSPLYYGYIMAGWLSCVSFVTFVYRHLIITGFASIKFFCGRQREVVSEK